MKRILLISFTAIFLLSACGSETETKPTNTVPDENANVNEATPSPELGGTLVLSGTSESLTIPCNQREVELDEDTTANTYTLTGECKKLLVDGVSNRIYVDKVGEIEVLGASNKVYYGEGLDGKAPKIRKKGTSLIVEKQKAKEE